MEVSKEEINEIFKQLKSKRENKVKSQILFIILLLFN